LGGRQSFAWCCFVCWFHISIVYISLLPKSAYSYAYQDALI